MPKPTKIQILAAKRAIVDESKASSSFVQRRLAIGYNAAVAIMEQLEAEEFVSKSNPVGKREILGELTPEERDADIGALEKAAKVTGTLEQVGRGDLSENEKSENYRVTAGELRQFIERYERLDGEKKDIDEQMKEVMSEAKARGYDTKIMRKIIALRKRDADDISEEKAVLEMYAEALGMDI